MSCFKLYSPTERSVVAIIYKNDPAEGYSAWCGKQCGLTCPTEVDGTIPDFCCFDFKHKLFTLVCPVSTWFCVMCEEAANGENLIKTCQCATQEKVLDVFWFFSHWRVLTIPCSSSKARERKGAAVCVPFLVLQHRNCCFEPHANNFAKCFTMRVKNAVHRIPQFRSTRLNLVLELST